MPEPKSQIRKIFNDQLAALREYCEKDEAGLANEAPSQFFSPDKGGWSGGLFDLEGLSNAFDREQLFEDFRATLVEEGLTTDLEVILLQGDFVAAMERAYRARHHTPVRSRCHAAARRMGHHDENGVLNKGLRGYLEHLKRLEGG